MKQLRSKAQLLQIATSLTKVLKHGRVCLQINGAENIQISKQNNKVDLNFLQKELLRKLLEFDAEMEEESILEKLEILKTIAERLKRDELTITISHKGQTVLKLGHEAEPTVSRIVIGTNAIEVTNFIELIRLIK